MDAQMIQETRYIFYCSCEYGFNILIDIEAEQHLLLRSGGVGIDVCSKLLIWLHSAEGGASKVQVESCDELVSFPMTCSVHDPFFEVEEALVSFDLDVDLSKLFDWNTHMIFVWLSAEYTHGRSVSLPILT